MSVYKVWCPERGQAVDDGRSVSAASHSEAAERWAAIDDARSADYTIVGGTSATVMVVADCEGAKPLTFEVLGRAEPVYMAVQVEQR